ncbi:MULTISPECIES: DUF6234 family protein [unclassified Streptomyces]|uniref:DUF6234 family protein n=1 Tax=unclassified Streptomyces TaxID=2593676 RepID=UPI001F1F4E95|nr:MULTISPECIES: DUF6234 family protein [unclassified Streptomyces]WKE70827.1 DUF6234 family protein [Streptomyces sp. WP-1]
MDLPVAPPAFDATTGPKQRGRADLGADIGAGCGLVFLELIALAVIFGLWFLSGVNLDPGRIVRTDSLWNYLAAAGGVGVLAVVAAGIGACAGAAVTVVTQAVMAALVCVIVFSGAAAQSHHDQLCRDIPAATGCKGGDWTAAARVTAARADSGPSRARRTMPRPGPRSSAGNRWRRP